MATKIYKDYQTAIHNALEKCQFVEETLRVYISLVIDIIRKKVGNIFPIRFSENDLSKLSLGKLVTIFSRLNDNVALKSSLSKITTERNFVAHRSFLFTIGELRDAAKLSELVHKIEEIKENAKNIHEALLEETWHLRRELRTLRHNKKVDHP